MSIRKDIDLLMADIQVDDKLKEDILNATTRQKKGRKTMKKKIMLVALAAVLSIGTIAVSAEGIKRLWNSTAANKYNLDEKSQEELIDKGYVQVIENNIEYDEDYSANYEGISMEVTQIISDNHSTRVYLGVNSEIESTEPRKGLEDAFATAYVDGEYTGIGAMVNIMDGVGDDSKYDAVYVVTVQSDGTELTGKELKIVVTSIRISTGPNFTEDYYMLDGNWEFKFNVKDSYDPMVVELNDTYISEQRTYEINALEIHPFSFCLKYETDTKESELSEMIHYGGFFSEDKEDVYFEEGEVFAANIPVVIKMKNGTAYSNVGMENNMIAHDFIYSTGVKGEVVSFYEKIDYSEIDYIEVAGKRCYESK